jgi:hypothetical protein
LETRLAIVVGWGDGVLFHFHGTARTGGRGICANRTLSREGYLATKPLPLTRCVRIRFHGCTDALELGSILVVPIRGDAPIHAKTWKITNSVKHTPMAAMKPWNAVNRPGVSDPVCPVQ